jgi:FlgD Ig-like domain/Kelch motif
MKKALLVGTLLLLMSGLALAQGWVNGPSSSGFRYWRFDGEYYAPTGKVYFLGGRNQDGTTSGRIWSFDPVAGVFTDEVVDMESPISNYNVCLLNDPTGPDSLALYVAGGRLSDGTNAPILQVYYPISGLAMSLTSDPFPGTVGGRVYTPAQGQVVVNNKMYVVGGLQVTAAPYSSDSTYVYDPAQPAGSRWSRLSCRLATARGYIFTTAVDGKIYAIGGSNYNGTGLQNFKIVERFDPANPGAGWVRMADTPDTLSEGQAFGFDTGSPYGLGGHIIVAPRSAWPVPFSECYDYNVATNTWGSFPSVIDARRAQAGFFVPGTSGSNGIPGMWIFGGRGTYSDTQVYYSTEYYQLTYSAVEEQGGVRLEKRTELQAPRPNPFAGRTVLRYSLAQSGPVSLAIYGITGQKVRTLVSENASAGTHEVAWDGRDAFGKPVGAGVYFARFAAENVHTTQRVTVLR